MPTGMLVMKWDERMGVNILASYPEETEIQERTLMQVYSQHEFTGEAGLVVLSAGAVHLASYYTGPETSVYVILLLTAEEDGDAHEEGLVEISRQILTTLEPEPLGKMLPSLFQRLSIYPTLNEEQRLAMLYNSAVKRMILERLRSESLLPKSEITIWLKDQYQEGFVDLDSIMSSLVKNGLVKISSVQGISSDIVFFNRDLMVLRVPPAALIKDPAGRHLPESLVDDYKTEVRNFFLNYEVSKEDNIKVIDEVLLDPAVYESVRLMREAIVTRNELEKLRKKGVDNVDRVLKILWQNKMIAVFKDEKDTEYYALLSDFHILKIYPKYNVDTIREQYRSRTKNPNSLVKALDLMKSEYYSMLEEQKSASKAEDAA